MIFDDQDINPEIKQEIKYLQGIVQNNRDASFEQIKGGYIFRLPNLHAWPRLVTRKIKYCKEMYCFDGEFSMKQLKLLESIRKFVVDNMRIENKRHEALTGIPPMYCSSSFTIKFLNRGTLYNTHIETGRFIVTDCTNWCDSQSVPETLPSHFDAKHVTMEGVERFDEFIKCIERYVDIRKNFVPKIHKDTFDQFMLRSFGLPTANTTRITFTDLFSRAIYLACTDMLDGKYYTFITSGCKIEPTIY